MSDTVRYLGAGSTAACAAVSLTNPMEVLKTTMQLRHELQAGKSQERFTLGDWLKREGGWRALQRGLSAAYLYQVTMNGIRLTLYDSLGSTGLNAVLLAGVAGALGAAAANPFNLIKTRMQSASSTYLDVGYQHGYRTLYDAAGKIYAKEGGWRGFYSGMGAAMLRTGMGTAVQLPTFDAAKNLLSRYLDMDGKKLSWTHHLAASMIASSALVLVMNPFDIIMTRLYNQPTRTPLYTGLLDCLSKVVRVEGPSALYKGLLPHYLRLGPHTVLTLVSYEHFKKRFGLE